MPIYEYKCDNGHVFDVMQRMSDDPLSTCQECGAPVQRVFHPIAVHFKGSGFYNTDYGTRRRQREAKESASSESGASNNGSSEQSEKKSESSSTPSSSTAASSSSAPSGD